MGITHCYTLKTKDTFEKIKKDIDNRYFENMVKKYLLENKHSSIVVLQPVKGLDEEKSQRLKEKLSAFMAGQNEVGTDKLVEDTKEFKAWQEKPDTKEDMDKLPKLYASDLKIEEEKSYTSIDDIDGSKVIFNKASTNGIASMGFYFDASKVPQEKLQYLSLLTQLLGRVSTTKNNYTDLSNEILSNTGKMDFSIKTYTRQSDSDIYYPKVVLTLQSLEENQTKAMELAEEIIDGSVFKDKEKIKQILDKSRAEMEAAFIASPNKVIGGKFRGKSD